MGPSRSSLASLFSVTQLFDITLVSKAARDSHPLKKHCQVLQRLDQNKFNSACLTRSARHFRRLYIIQRFGPRIQNGLTISGTRALFRQRTDVLCRLSRPRVPGFQRLLQRNSHLFLIRSCVRNPACQSLLTQQRTRNDRFSRTRIARLLARLLPLLRCLRKLKLMRQSVSPSGLLRHGTSNHPILVSFNNIGRLLIGIHCRLNIPRPCRSTAKRIAQLKRIKCTPRSRHLSNRTDPASSLCTLNIATVMLLAKRRPASLCSRHRGH